MDEAKIIYLDVCVLSRPFDDQRYLRIRLETEAINLILSKVKEGKYSLLISPVLIKEIESIDDLYERMELQTILEKFSIHLTLNTIEIRERADKLVDLGFGIADAAHIAFAEKAGVPFISCDDRLIKKCQKHEVKIWCGNPVTFCEKEGLR